MPQDPDEGLAPQQPPGDTPPFPAPVPEQGEVPAATPPPPPPLQHSGQERKVPSHPGNVYREDRHPVEQHRDVQQLRQWKDTVGDEPGRSQPPSSISRQRQVPGPSTGPPPHDDLLLTPLGSDDEVENLVVTQLAQEGGVAFMNYLLSKAIPFDSHIVQTASIREWTYKDILHLPKAKCKEWKAACCEELECYVHI